MFWQVVVFSVAGKSPPGGKVPATHQVYLIATLATAEIEEAHRLPASSRGAQVPAGTHLPLPGMSSERLRRRGTTDFAGDRLLGDE